MIKENLLQDEVLQPCVLSPPLVCCDTSVSKNSSDQFVNTNSPSALTAQDEEHIKILEDLGCNKITSENTNLSDESRLSGYFCSDTVFNLSKRVLSETEIKILEKGLDYAPIQRKINEPKLKNDIEEFCRRMRIKWHFRNEPSENFSEIPSFRPKLSWKPPKGNPNLEMLLSKVEQNIFKTIETPIRYSNLSSDEWKAIRSLADDRSIVIKKADKGSAVVV